MVGLAAFGTMNAMLARGARIAAERAVGWNRQLRTHAAFAPDLLPRQGPDRLPDGAVTIALLYLAGAPSACASGGRAGWR